MRAVNEKLRKAIENEGHVVRIEGLWWQFSLTELGPREPSAVSLLRISRDHDGALELSGRSWQEDGSLSARYWSEAVKERKEPPGIFYYWKGERPRDPNAPQMDGTGEIRMESADRAAGYFTTRADTRPKVTARTAGVYWRADPQDMSILDGRDDRQRVELSGATEALEVDHDLLAVDQDQPSASLRQSASDRDDRSRKRIARTMLCPLIEPAVKIRALGYNRA
jgi:hypothetical protein